MLFLIGYIVIYILLDIRDIILQQKDRVNDEQEGGRCTNIGTKYTRDAGCNAEGGS